MADKNHILRLYNGGQTGTDWHENSNGLAPYTPKDIEEIVDPQAATAKKEITSIPSPFARLHLMESAFRVVNGLARKKSGGRVNIAGLEGDTIHHKLVSDCWDVAETFFKFDLFKQRGRDMELTRWNRDEELKTLLESSHPQHVLLGETLKLYLGQDGGTSGFANIDGIHLLAVDHRVVGGTSPSTLFFTSGNDLTFANFKVGNDIFFDEEFCPLFKRSDTLFLKYVYGLFKVHSELTTKMPLMWDHLEISKDALLTHNRALHRELLAYINDLDKDKFYADFERWSGTSSVYVMRGVEHLKKGSEGKSVSPKNNDFLIKSTKYTGPKPVVLQNHFTRPLKFFGGVWNSSTSVPYKDDKPLGERFVPGQDVKYPYLTVSDFLEPYLVRLPYYLDDKYFFTGNPQGFFLGDVSLDSPPDDMFLIPIREEYFRYFDPEYLMGETTNGDKVFKLVKVGDDAVRAELLVPIHASREYIKFERTYHFHTKPDEHANQGGGVLGRLSLGFLPFNNAEGDHSQIVGLVDADAPLEGKNQYELEFICNTPDSFTPVNKDGITSTTRSNVELGHQHQATSTYYLLKDQYHAIKVKQIAKGPSGLVLPLNKPVPRGSKRFTFAIDFGTTNSHVEYIYDRENPRPFDIGDRDRQLITTVDPKWGAYEQILLDLLTRELVPLKIGEQEIFNFPQRTAVAEIEGFNHHRTMHSLADISIPFGYEKLAKLDSEEIITNLKWKRLSGGDQGRANANRIEAFIETLMIIIKNKVLLNGGNPKTTDIVWFYPSSMSVNQINGFRRIWTELYKRHFSPDGRPVDYSESEVPFYTHDAKTDSYGHPVINIDIGGGTTDIVAFKDETPQFLTSIKFAGSAVFGEGYNKAKSANNGFVTVFSPKVKRFLEENQNDLNDLYEVFNQLTQKGASTSSDIMAFFFSMENSYELRKNKLRFSISTQISSHAGFNMVFLVFIGAIVFHIAKLMKRLGMGMPRNICLSGNGSKTINLLDESPDLDNVEQFSKLLFERVYGQEYHYDGLQYIQGDKPKEATCKGGLMRHRAGGEPRKFDKIVLIGDETGSFINTRRYNFDTNNIKYPELKNNTVTVQRPIEGSDEMEEVQVPYLDSVIKEVEEFIDMVCDINDDFSYQEHFGIDTGKLEEYRKILKSDIKGSLRRGLDERLKLGDQKRSVEESLFFYPLRQSLYKLTQEIAKG